MVYESVEVFEFTEIQQWKVKSFKGPVVKDYLRHTDGGQYPFLVIKFVLYGLYTTEKIFAALVKTTKTM